MAEYDHTNKQDAPVESQDRGLFDFMKKKPQDETISNDEQKVHVTDEPEHKYGEEHNKEEKHESLLDKFTHSGDAEHHKVEEPQHEEEKKHGGLLDKLTRSDSHSSSSSEEEVEENGEKKKKKKLKEKIKDKVEGKYENEKYDEKPDIDTSVKMGKVDEPIEKKGFVEKIKEKIPGGDHKKEEEVPTSTAPIVVDTISPESHNEKKSIMDKIKEKMPGYKSEEEKEKEKAKVEGEHHY